MDEVRQWQTRPLESVYPIVYVDCLVVNVRENQRVLNKALAPFARRQPGRTQGTLGDVDCPKRRSQVLVVGAHRTAKPWRERYLHCLRRWAHPLTRSH